MTGQGHDIGGVPSRRGGSASSPRPRTKKAIPLSPEPAPSFDPLDLVLHIGSGKTGTSSVQQFLDQNRGWLAEQGLLVPRSPGRRRHVRLGLYIKSDDAVEDSIAWQRQKEQTPEKFRRVFRRKLFREVAESGLSRMLLSDEALYGSPEAALRRMRSLTDEIARSLRLVAYLRRQDDHLASRYQQVIKIGEVRRMTDRVQDDNLAATYDYHARLSAWRRILEPTEFVVRRFERDRFANGSLYQDFLEAAGVDAPTAGLEPVKSSNESLDAESVEFLRVLNIYRKEHEGLGRGVRGDRLDVPGNVLGRLAEHGNGPTLTLPEPQLDAFMAQWEQSNRAVAREFLGDESGELFRSPRKDRGTTTVQYLDPARVGHFVTLLELPQRMHAPLRTIAEREADSAEQSAG